MLLPEFWIPNAIAFALFFIYGSFFEWALHKFVMHKRTWPPYPYELHALIHHHLFRADGSFHALSEEMKEHVCFVPRDYFYLLALHVPLFVGVELLIGHPVALGCGLATLTYLGMFDLLHWCFHVPAGRWFEQLWPYRWIKHHHLLHHRHQDRNLNVVFPLADLVLGTLIRKPRSGTVLEV